MEIKRIDIGINLMNKQFKDDRLEIVNRALENGTGLIITGTDLYSSEQAIDFIRENNLKNVWCTVGVHPHNANEVDGEYYGELISLIRKNKDIVAAVDADDDGCHIACLIMSLFKALMPQFIEEGKYGALWCDRRGSGAGFHLYQ